MWTTLLGPRLIGPTQRPCAAPNLGQPQHSLRRLIWADTTPKAFANFSPGLPQPWGSPNIDNSNAVSVGEASRIKFANAFSVASISLNSFPRVEATLGCN